MNATVVQVNKRDSIVHAEVYHGHLVMVGRSVSGFYRVFNVTSYEEMDTQNFGFLEHRFDSLDGAIYASKMMVLRYYEVVMADVAEDTGSDLSPDQINRVISEIQSDLGV